MFTSARAAGGVGARGAIGGALALAASLAVLSAPTGALAATVTANPLAGLAGFTVVSAGDLALGNHELEGSVAAGGDVRVTSAQPYGIIHTAAGNADYSLPRSADGTFYRLVAGGTFDLAGSSGSLRVSSGGDLGTAASQGRIALGDVSDLTTALRGAGVCVQELGSTDCSGITLEQSRFPQTAASVAQPGLFDEFVGADAQRSLVDWSDRIASGAILNTVPVSLHPAGSDYALSLTEGAVNVWTIAAADLPAGDWKLAFDSAVPSAATPLIIRIAAADGEVVRLPAETIGFQSSPGGVHDDRYAPYMLWNIEQSVGQSVSVTSSGIVPGSILAPRSALTTGPGKTLIEGQIYAAEVALRNDGEIHHYAFVPELSVDDTAVPATGGFRIRKVLSGPAGLVPADTEFTVTFSIDGGPAQHLALRADGTPVSIIGLRAGSRVTFAETARPDVAGVTWGAATFSAASLTVAAGETTPVDLTNAYTAAAAAGLSSQAYAGEIANGTLETPATPVIDRVAYTDLVPGAHYELRGELVYVANGQIRHTGITNTIGFTAASSPTDRSSGSVESVFRLTQGQFASLAGVRLLVVEELYGGAGEHVASEGPADASDPWIAATSQWVRVADAPVSPSVTTVPSATVLAMTGSTIGLPLGAAATALLLGALLLAAASPRLRSRTVTPRR